MDDVPQYAPGILVREITTWGMDKVKSESEWEGLGSIMVGLKGSMGSRDADGV